MSISDEEFTRIKTHATDMESADGLRNTLYDQLDAIYHMDPGDLPDADWIKQTISPDGRNAVNGAVRLLTGADPIFSVPAETNPARMRKIADRLERAAQSMWTQAGLVAERPIHYDAALSGVHYSEIHILLESAKSIADLQPGAGSKAHAQRVAARAPVLFTVVNPRDGHAQKGPTGLRAYYSKRTLTVAEMQDRFGSLMEETTRKSTDTIEVHDYWSRDWHVIWSAEQAKPYIAEPNKDGFIPVVVVTCEGSALWNKSGQDQHQGLLYTVHKSGLWDRKNLYLTVMNSLVFAVGSNPVLVHETNDEDGKLMIDYDQPGGIVKIRPGEKLYALLQKIIDPQIVEQMLIVDKLFEESTIYKTAFGQSLGANAPFSMVSLLAQAGRLPLVIYQRMISIAITMAIAGAFHIARRDGATIMASGKTGQQELKAKDIPEQFDVQAVLDITLPQDDRVNVQIAIQGIQARLFSKRHGREKYAKIGQTQEMDDEIAEESFADQATQLELQKELLKGQIELQQLQMQLAQMAQPGQGGMPGGPMQGGAEGPPAPEQMPPEMMAGGPPPEMGDPGMQGVSEGMPMAAPQEPMGSPMGPGGMPPEMGMME